MSRRVHLLQFLSENIDFFKQTIQGDMLISILNKGKKYDKYISEIVDHFNKKKNITCSGIEMFNALTVPKFKILVALLAKKLTIVNPLTLRRCRRYLIKTPKRFQEYFAKLLVPGFWLLGAVIEDSLSENTSINRGNPFDFLPGDLGFWWAGAVIMDWINIYFLKKKIVSYSRCIDFYNDCCLSTKYKYCQRSALSHMGRVPQQFLGTQDEITFLDTIQNAGFPEFSLDYKNGPLELELALKKLETSELQGELKSFSCF